MATWTTRTTTSTRREWIIPADQPWGAALGDIEDAVAAAARAYREEYSLPDDRALAGDALRFHTVDDQIVISFTIEETP